MPSFAQKLKGSVSVCYLLIFGAEWAFLSLYIKRFFNLYITIDKNGENNQVSIKKYKKANKKRNSYKKTYSNTYK